MPPSRLVRSNSYRELTAPRSLPRRVSEVAVRWGFENPSHFNRLFKAAFGAAPRRWSARRAAGLGRLQFDLSTSQRIETFHEWAVDP